MGMQVTKEIVPSYNLVEDKIKEMDGAVIIFRIFYIPEKLTYSFQLLRNNRICMVEITSQLLEDLKKRLPSSDDELTIILNTFLKDSGCWSKS